MSIVGQDPIPHPCVNHSGRSTVLSCGKCGNYICTRCAVQTPVGTRCKDCAQMRRPTQFDVGPWLLARSTAAGLLVSIIGWFVASFIPYLGFFLAIGVGAGVGEVMSRLARRRRNRALEGAAVGVILVGLVAAQVLHPRYTFVFNLSQDTALLIGLALPALIASFVAIVKLR